MAPELKSIGNNFAAMQLGMFFGCVGALCLDDRNLLGFIVALILTALGFLFFNQTAIAAVSKKFAVITSLLLIALLPASASAANCNQFFVQKQYAYAAPIVAAYAYPQVQYLAGQDIQAEALAEKVARLVDKKLELRLSQRQQQVVAKPQSMISQHCAKCHSGATPKASLTYDGVTPLPASLVVAALKQISTEAMPKDHKIDAALKGQIMAELLELEAAPISRVAPGEPIEEPALPPPPRDDGGLR